MTTTPDITLTPDIALEFGDELLRQLAQHIGDLDGLNGVFRHWHEVLGDVRFACVAMAALQTTFADCLTMTPLEQIPQGSHVYVDPDQEQP